MPPKGSRVVHADNDSRSDGSSSKAQNNPRNKRPNGGSNLKDTANAQDAAQAQSASSSNGVGLRLGSLKSCDPRLTCSQFSWAHEDLSFLHNYRAAHRMETPSAFHSIRNQFLLTNPGIGRQSPTMARRKNKRKVAKEQLALAVRKNFNDAAVNEIDVMVDLLYKVRNQGMSYCPGHEIPGSDSHPRQVIPTEISTYKEPQVITLHTHGCIWERQDNGVYGNTTLQIEHDGGTQYSEFWGDGFFLSSFSFGSRQNRHAGGH